jgi:hypothetical protein
MLWIMFFWGLAFGFCYAFTIDGQPGRAALAMGLGCAILIPVSFIHAIISALRR